MKRYYLSFKNNYFITFYYRIITMTKIKKSTLQKDHNILLNQFAELVRNLKALNVIPQEVCPTYTPKSKQLDHSIFNGLDDTWKFAAVDANGDAYLFGECPEKDLEMKQWDIHHTKECSFIDGVFNSTDWENSLIERKDIVIAGNDICTHLLSTNSRLVMCLVSDTSERHAIKYQNLAIINGKEDQRFTSISPFTWKYAVPVNNMGEPLTAKDVGL